MTAVALRVPHEILVEAGLTGEGVRDPGQFSVALDGLNAAAAVVTIATVVPQLQALAAAIRRWVFQKNAKTPVVLTVRGPGVEVTLDLRPNASTAEILRALRKLVDD